MYPPPDRYLRAWAALLLLRFFPEVFFFSGFFGFLSPKLTGLAMLCCSDAAGPSPE